MFSNDSQLTSAEGLEDWNVSNVTDFAGLFSNDVKLQDISALADWDTPSATDMSYIFYNNHALENIDSLAGWDTSNVTNLSFMFHASRISDISALTDWKTGKVEALEYFISGNGTYPSRVTSLEPLADWDVSSVTTMGSMCRYCKSLTSLAGLENWDVSNVLNFSEGNDPNNNRSEGTFQYLTSLQDASAINNWNINKNAAFNNMFKNTPVHPEFTKVQGTWSNGTFTPTN
jgi:surface protein